MQKPLVMVLAAQLLVLVGAVGFMATRSNTPAPVKHARERPLPAPEEVLHASPAKLQEPLASDGGEEWAAFPAEAPAKKERGHAESPPFEAIIAELQQGNVRFVEGVSRQRDVLARREVLGEGEQAMAVVVTCTDSRVVPELLFDQPLGTFAVVRLPGAQVDEAGARAVEDSVSRLHARAVLVLGHLGCHHVQHALEGAGPTRAGRPTTLKGALGGLDKADDEAATTASVSFAARDLRRRSKQLAKATDVTMLRVVYAPKTGKLRWLDAEPEAEAAPRSGRR
ncbi:MAG: carbonic anhydrase [Archangium sp.]|nr:carbonic anhydrase [Archangium sp.]